jgi:hypothetical protein
MQAFSYTSHFAVSSSPQLAPASTCATLAKHASLSCTSRSFIHVLHPYTCLLSYLGPFLRAPHINGLPFINMLVWKSSSSFPMPCQHTFQTKLECYKEFQYIILFLYKHAHYLTDNLICPSICHIKTGYVYSSIYL